MSFTLDKIFTTETAIGSTHIISEVATCIALKPYIRCFWEANYCLDKTEFRIIPDCCADILFNISNEKMHCNFCGISNRSFISKGNAKTFGIRFYAWSVNLFSSVKMNNTLNSYLPANVLFDNIDDLAAEILYSNTLNELILL